MYYHNNTLCSPDSLKRRMKVIQVLFLLLTFDVIYNLVIYNLPDQVCNIT